MLTIDGEEKQLLRLNDSHKVVHKIPDSKKHLVLGKPHDATAITVGAWVDDAIHVQVEVICGTTQGDLATVCQRIKMYRQSE
jgi:hypothetical protein